MLAISQIEVSVKTFWSEIYEEMPKAEVGSVGMTFAESEVRHMDAYSHLLDILGIADDFEEVTEVPAIKQRIEYLDDYLEGAKSDDRQEYVKSIMLFSTFVEHVSLFSQFLIMTSFDKYEKKFKGISNAVEATSKEEQIHGLFGVELVNTIREENPDMFVYLSSLRSIWFIFSCICVRQEPQIEGGSSPLFTSLSLHLAHSIKVIQECCYPEVLKR